MTNLWSQNIIISVVVELSGSCARIDGNSVIASALDMVQRIMGGEKGV